MAILASVFLGLILGCVLGMLIAIQSLPRCFRRALDQADPAATTPDEVAP